MPVHEGYLIVISDGPNTRHPGAYAKGGSLFGPSSNYILKTSISALSAIPHPTHLQWRGHLQLQTAPLIFIKISLPLCLYYAMS